MEKPNFIIDIDGVMTTGQFLYSGEGKAYKTFGPHDADGLKLIKDHVNIIFISADKRGFHISKKRTDDMGYPILHVTEDDRYNYIKDNFGFANTFYIGDGLNDVNIIRDSKFGIAPANARVEAKKVALFVTPSNAAEGAVCDACLEIKRKFFDVKNSSDYKVVILAGGIGTRMGEFSKFYNKVLIPVQGKPTICHIIEKFPEDVEIIISLNYKKDDLKTYLTYAYLNRKFIFIEDKPSPEGFKGPGYGMLQCKEELQCPFIFISGDTLVRENIPTPDENWFGLAEVPDTSRFCSAKIDEKSFVVKIDDKVKSENKYAFIGLAGVKDYQHFWYALENNKNLISGEIQVSNGFVSLIDKGMRGIIFTWFDTGNPDAYKHALEQYPHGHGYKGA